MRCSMTARSRNSAGSPPTTSATSAWPKRSSRATASSPASARSTAAASRCTRRTSPSSAAPSRSAVAQGLQDHGAGDGERHPGRRPARLRRRAHPGGRPSLAAYGELFVRNVMASGVVPQISVQMGPCAGGAVYSPALTDFIVMVRKTGYMFITGPDVIKAVTGEQVDFDTLGGAVAHNTRSGVAHFAAETRWPRSASSRNCSATCPRTTARTRRASHPTTTRPPRRLLDHLVPEDSSQPYDMRQVISSVFDRGSFLEVHAHYAKNALVGLARLDGFPVGVVANQPMFLAGVLDIDSATRSRASSASATHSTCPSSPSSTRPATCPASRRSTAASSATARRSSTPTARPPCQRSASCAQGDGRRVHRDEQQADAHRPGLRLAERGDCGHGAGGRDQHPLSRGAQEGGGPGGRRKQLLQEYVDRFHNPYAAADMGQIDEVIEPSFTRLRLDQRARDPAVKGRQQPAQEARTDAGVRGAS
jgi:propionyl-CoA carboxylase beta chain